MRYETASEAALYVWDYFYLAHIPAEGDEAPWAAIERATGRIRESIQYFTAPRPADVRVHHAKRVRRSVRIVMKNLALLSTETDRWVIEELARFAALADALIATHGQQAGDIVLD